MILVTGGAGFIGANFVIDWFKNHSEPVITLDALTYAGKRENLSLVEGNPQHQFVHGNILNQTLLDQLLSTHKPRAVIHFAAESHVDRSITDSKNFIETNILGTYTLLESTRRYWEKLGAVDAQFAEKFRFLHISTDEVYGSLAEGEPAFSETTPYCPNSPYSASKAASDHLVRAWHHTYGLPVLTTNCSNNYGPLQFPEKLIPLTIINALQGKWLPVYGDGLNVRDWLYVFDHCDAIRRVLKSGKVGEVYNIGGNNQMCNIDIVTTICEILDIRSPDSAKAVGGSHKKLIQFVTDRPGHDRRYAMDTTKINKQLGWNPKETFTSGISKTVDWYIKNNEKKISLRTPQL